MCKDEDTGTLAGVSAGHRVHSAVNVGRVKSSARRSHYFNVLTTSTTTTTTTATDTLQSTPATATTSSAADVMSRDVIIHRRHVAHHDAGTVPVQSASQQSVLTCLLCVCVCVCVCVLLSLNSATLSRQCIEVKQAVMVYKALNGLSPQQLVDEPLPLPPATNDFDCRTSADVRFSHKSG